MGMRRTSPCLSPGLGIIKANIVPSSSGVEGVSVGGDMVQVRWSKEGWIRRHAKASEMREASKPRPRRSADRAASC